MYQKDRKPIHKSAPKKQQQRRLDAHEFKLIEAKREGKLMRFLTLDGELQGIVTNFDKYSIVVREQTGVEHCLFKHAVNSFAPMPV